MVGGGDGLGTNNSGRKPAWPIGVKIVHLDWAERYWSWEGGYVTMEEGRKGGVHRVEYG